MENDPFQQLEEAILAGNVPQMVFLMMSTAIESRASDIHIEPARDTTRVRYRIDGVLRQIIEYPPNMHPAVVSRIKIMSNLKIDEQRIPQDGRTQVVTKDHHEIDLRISAFPTVFGEKVVMRLQDKSKKIPTFAELGLDGNNLEFLQKGLDAPNGIVLNSGPTGSGKTTTLYACLSVLNTPEVNILTIEDPVEIQLEGLNQSQVHPDINYTFEFGLRCALRQDPDIIMVGEIRDHDTMEVAIQSALTGHLVLSTIHTNSSVESITRMSNMDVPTYLINSTVDAILSQRLVRKICEKCREPFSPDPQALERVKRSLSLLHPREKARYEEKLLHELAFYQGKGCEACDHAGYLGRVGIFEVLFINNIIRKLIFDQAPSIDIEKAALGSGMVNLEQSGILKALRGITTLEEVFSVTREIEFLNHP